MQLIAHLTADVPMSNWDVNALLTSQVENVQLSGEVELCIGTSPFILMESQKYCLHAGNLLIQWFFKPNILLRKQLDRIEIIHAKAEHGVFTYLFH